MQTKDQSMAKLEHATTLQFLAVLVCVNCRQQAHAANQRCLVSEAWTWCCLQSAVSQSLWIMDSVAEGTLRMSCSGPRKAAMSINDTSILFAPE